MNPIVANDEMLTIKESIDKVHQELTNKMNEINTNFDTVASSWSSSKSKVVLLPIEDIKKENTRILEKIKEKSDQIKSAYDTYLKAQDTTIVQVIASPKEAESVVPEQTVVQNPNLTIEEKLQDLKASGETIVPSFEMLEFVRNKDGSFKRHGNTDLYPAKITVDGKTITYLLYLGGRAPDEQIPKDLPVLMALHGSGETRSNYSSNYSSSEASRSIKNTFGGNFGDPNNKKEVIAILPQFSKGTYYREDTMNVLHTLYTRVKESYGTRAGLDISGLSMGGQSTIKYASMYPQDISTATVIAAGPPEGNFLRLDEQSYENLKKVKMVFVCGDQDSKQYSRSLNLLGTLTGNSTTTYTINKGDPIDPILNSHYNNGGIVHITVSGAGHNTWDLASPAVVSKYN